MKQSFIDWLWGNKNHGVWREKLILVWFNSASRTLCSERGHKLSETMLSELGSEKYNITLQVAVRVSASCMWNHFVKGKGFCEAALHPPCFPLLPYYHHHYQHHSQFALSKFNKDNISQRSKMKGTVLATVLCCVCLVAHSQFALSKFNKDNISQRSKMKGTVLATVLCCVCLVAQLCLTVCDPMDCSPPALLLLCTCTVRASGKFLWLC